MKKHLKILNILLIFTAIFSIMIITKDIAMSAQNIPTQTATSGVAAPKTIPQKNAYAITHMENKGFKFAFLKFVIAMIGVIVSATAIWLGLKFYKNIVLKNNSKLDTIDYDKSLESPKDFKEAINLFLNKTDK